MPARHPVLPACLALLALTLGAVRLPAQTSTPAQAPPAASPQTPPPPTPKPPVPTIPSPAPPDAVAAALAKPMSRQQRKQLLDSVDPMTDFVSADTALPIRHRVKRKLISRDEIGRYLHKRFKDDESNKRLERDELVLKKFGLLDRSFDLEPFLISLLTEQIAGFYDNKTKTVNLLDWVSPAEQKPVLAHELTHALQDQFLEPTGGLEKWGDSGVHGVAKTIAEDRQHLAVDELETSREAVAEGQAMIVFFDDALRSSGRTLADLPDTSQLLADTDDDDADKSSPVLAKAPLLLRESLLFPYTDGLTFEHTVLRRRGKSGAFADVLTHPPSSTFQIIHPSAYLAGTPVPTLPVPDLHPLLDPAYEPYDVGLMGELDVRILAQVLGGKPAAGKLSPAWDGGLYYAAQRRADTPAQKATTASIVLVYQSRWRTPAAARSFLALYALGLHHQYPGLHRRAADELAPAASEADEQIYTTSEGDAVLARSGRTVLITEGLPLPLARQIRLLFGDIEPTGPQMQASLVPHAAATTLPPPPHELSLGLATLLRLGTPLPSLYTSN